MGTDETVVGHPSCRVVLNPRRILPLDCAPVHCDDAAKEGDNPFAMLGIATRSSPQAEAVMMIAAVAVLVPGASAENNGLANTPPMVLSPTPPMPPLTAATPAAPPLAVFTFCPYPCKYTLEYKRTYLMSWHGATGT